MSNNTKFKLARFVLFLAIFVLCCAVWAIEKSNLHIAIPVIVASLAAGLYAAPIYYTYKEYRFTNKTSAEIEHEVMQKLQKQKSKKHNN